MGGSSSRSPSKDGLVRILFTSIRTLAPASLINHFIHGLEPNVDTINLRPEAIIERKGYELGGVKKDFILRTNIGDDWEGRSWVISLGVESFEVSTVLFLSSSDLTSQKVSEFVSDLKKRGPKSGRIVLGRVIPKHFGKAPETEVVSECALTALAKELNVEGLTVDANSLDSVDAFFTSLGKLATKV